jgi:hypothetical protein
MRGLRSIAARLRGLGSRLGGVGAGLLTLIPALIAGAGVFLVVAGLFNYVSPAVAEAPSGQNGASEILPSFSFEPLATLSPGASPTPANSPATRVVVPALGIDLPVIASKPNESFPLCDVAEYFVDANGDPLMAHPGANGATYMYAHARAGMFLPLLNASKVNNGAAMIGDPVEVYTDDDQNHVYEITEVIRHVPVSASALDRPMGATTDQLWLQTSEGPLTSSPKLQVLAMPVGALAVSYADAHPVAKPRRCS